MKKFLAMIMMGVMILMLAACGTNGDVDQAEGAEPEEETPEEEVTEEVDMDALINQLAMDAGVETTADAANFNFSLINTGEEAVTLGFTSSQQYEIQVANADGENVYTFSSDKSFAQAETSEELAAEESLTASEGWTSAVPGQYEATITFLVDTINGQSVEATPFEITQPFTIEEPQKEEEQDQSEAKEFEGDGEAFRNIKVTGENGSYVVSGEARVFEASFMYSIEDGHNVLVEPTPVQVDGDAAPSWSPFEIEVSISEENLPEFGTVTMSIFEESAKDGKPTNVNYIPLENFQPTE
ncbi:hypothetical protein LCM20_03310 [Halobacillus litoralis]|uniref:BsuPI-related putative proteinase inhibitor n=1 Tax=Halobacillus litoralis TaxID=45668 RepID=UPI001CD3DB5F|nr:BsuPI-related putative proteinase inhibitor [Halobacillus litoralis]MCA0969620.1 hypothetical protein [Halobacillus litoralis]